MSQCLPLTWEVTNRAEHRSRLIADRHYSRQKVGSKQFVPPGRCLVLRAGDRALWVTSWPYAKYVKHTWGGAWVNSLFRNEGAGLSSTMIREAISITRAYWPNVPDLGMVTFIDPSKVRHTNRPGWCYIKAGFIHAGFTKGGLWVYQLLPVDMPAAKSATDPHPLPTQE